MALVPDWCVFKFRIIGSSGWASRSERMKQTGSITSSTCKFFNTSATVYRVSYSRCLAWMSPILTFSFHLRMCSICSDLSGQVTITKDSTAGRQFSDLMSIVKQCDKLENLYVSSHWLPLAYRRRLTRILFHKQILENRCRKSGIDFLFNRFCLGNPPPVLKSITGICPRSTTNSWSASRWHHQILRPSEGRERAFERELESAKFQLIRTMVRFLRGSSGRKKCMKKYKRVQWSVSGYSADSAFSRFSCIFFFLTWKAQASLC